MPEPGTEQDEPRDVPPVSSGTPDTRYSSDSLPPTLMPSGEGPGGDRQAGGTGASQAASRYRIVRSHARGGLGEVFVAVDEELGREVALKEIQGRHADDLESRARFLLEAEVTGQLEHPGIVPVYGLACYPDGRPFYAMRFIKGQSLKDAIRRFHEDASLRADPGKWSLELRKLLERFRDVCNAIAYAHSKGVLHRDLKPDNVMLGEYGETLVVDWGLARVMGRKDRAPVGGEALRLSAEAQGSGCTQVGSVLGTPAYMPPEQAEGKLDDLGPASDVYSLGATLYHLLTGKAPFVDPNMSNVLAQVGRGEFLPPRRVNSAVPAPLEAVCLKAMALKPEDRYGSPRALADDVEHWLADEPVTALPETTGQRWARWARRHRSWMRAGTAALLVIVGVLIVAVLIVTRSREQEQAALRNEKAARANEQAALAEQQAALNESRRQSAFLALDRGMSLCDQGNTRLGLLWLSRSLTMAPAGAADLDRVVRLNLASRGRQLSSARILAHQGYVHAVAFSPDGRHVLTGSGAGDKGQAQLWDTATGNPLGEPLSHPGWVEVVAFDLDGKVLLTSSTDRTLRRWDAATGKPLGEPLRLESTGDSLAFSPNGKLLLTGRPDPYLWDTATGKRLANLSRLDLRPFAAVFSPDGNTVLVGGWMDSTIGHQSSGFACLWDVTARKFIGEPLEHKDGVEAVAFSPDGKRFLTGSRDRTAQLWDTATRKPLGNPLVHPGWVEAVAFSPDGKTLCTASGFAHRDDAISGKEVLRGKVSGGLLKRGEIETHGHLYRWDAVTGKPLGEPLPHQGMVVKLAFSPDGRTLASASQLDRTARLWNLEPPLSAGEPLQHPDAVTAVAFSPDGKRLLTGSADRSARVWDVATGQPLGNLLRPRTEVRKVAFLPDGKTVLLGTAGLVSRLDVHSWDVATGQPANNPLQLPGDPTRDILFRPDNKALLAIGEYGPAQLWDFTEGKPLATERTRLAAFSPDNKLVLTVGSGIRLWDAVTGKPMGEPMVVPNQSVATVAFSPDSKRVLVAAQTVDPLRASTGTAFIWDVASTKLVGEPMRHERGISVVAFSSDGKTVLTGSADRTARLWEAGTGKPLTEPLRHQMQVTAAAFAPDGKRVLTGACSSEKGEARLWDAATGKPLGESLAHPGTVEKVAFSPGGNTLLIWGAATLRTWDATSGKRLSEAQVSHGRVDCSVLSPDGKVLLTGSTDKTARLWDTTTGKLIDKPLRHHGRVQAVAFASNGKTAFTASNAYRLHWGWDLATGKPLEIDEDRTTVSSRPDVLAISDDGQTLVLAEQQDRALLGRVTPFVYFVDAATAQIYDDNRFEHSEPVLAAAFSPDGELLVTGSADRTARLWKAGLRKKKPYRGPKTGGSYYSETPVGGPFKHQGFVTAVAFSRDGKTILTGSADRTARLWDVATGEPVGEPLQHSATVSAVAFSPDGNMILTASAEAAQLWDTDTRKPIGDLLRHQDRITALAFSPDGKHIATGSADRTARLWRTPMAVPGEVERIILWTQVSAGMVLDAKGSVRELEVSAWNECFKRLQELGGPPIP